MKLSVQWTIELKLKKTGVESAVVEVEGKRRATVRVAACRTEGGSQHRIQAYVLCEILC